MLYTIDSHAFNTCESNSSVAETASTGACIDPNTAEVTRLLSLVSGKDAEIEQLTAKLSLVSSKDAEMEQLIAENERLRAYLPTTADADAAVPTPSTSVEALVSTDNTSTVDNWAYAHSSQVVSSETAVAGHATSQYSDIEKLMQNRILSAWSAAGYGK